MELRLLGSVELVTPDGVTRALGSPKQRALLAALGLRAGEVVPVWRLVDELWPHQPPDSGATTLQSHVSGLRRVVGGSALRSSREGGYLLAVEPGNVDVHRFEELVNRGEAALAHGEASRAAGQLRQALDLWRGEALADVPDGPIAQAARTRLGERYLEAVEARTSADLASGRHAELIGELEALVAAHPFRERLWAHLMLALYRSGRQADALDCYQRAHARLDEIGLEPTDELGELQQRILRHDPALTAPAAAPPASPEGAASASPAPARPAADERFRLPASRETPVGRDDDVAALRRRLETSRLVTLTGPGGAGKSTLAAHVGRLVEADFADGAVLIELAHTDAAGDLGAAVMAALGAKPRADDTSLPRVATALGDRHVLLVLDNCEHVLAAAGELVDVVLDACPHVQILATSRHPLECRGEQRWPVPPLAVPAVDADADEVAASPAVRLFLRRAQAVDPHFADTGDELAVISRIVRELDGIPLAIELAASRVGALSVDEIAEHLAERFRLLRGGARDTAARHQTLENALAWSEQLLDETEQRTLRRLAALPGGADRHTAAAVLFDPSADDEAAPDDFAVAEALDRLVRKSLVLADRTGGRTRYRMLETIRAYFLQRLDQVEGSEATRRRLAVELRDLGQQAGEALRGPDDAGVLTRLDDELTNLTAVRSWALGEGDPAVLFDLVTHLPLIAEMRVRPLLYDVMETAADAAERMDHPAWPAVAAATAVCRAVRGDADRARHQLAVALERLPAGDGLRTVAGLFRVHVAVMTGETDVGVQAGQAAVADARTAGDAFLETFAMSALVLALAAADHHDEARARLGELRALSSAQDSTSLAAWCAYLEGEVLAGTAPEEAQHHYQRAIDLGRRSGADAVTGVALIGLSALEARHGTAERALPVFAEALAHHYRGSRWQMCWAALINLTELLSRLGEHAAALEILGAAEHSATCAPVYGEAAARWAAVVADAEHALGPEATPHARRRGAARSDAAAVRAALEVIARLRAGDATPPGGAVPVPNALPARPARKAS